MGAKRKYNFDTSFIERCILLVFGKVSAAFGNDEAATSTRLGYNHDL